MLSSLDNARVLAGGQSLMAMLNLRLAFPDHLVDINRVSELDLVERSDGVLRLGAMIRQRRIETAPEIAAVVPLLREAVRQVGHRQTRNRGTLGGSLCHLDPAAELPAVALLCDAAVHVAGPSGTRTIPAADFMAGYMTPALEPGELVTAVEFPLWPEGHGYAFTEYVRRHGDFALAAAGTLIEAAPDGRIARAAIVVAGVEPLPVRLPEAEALLSGERGEPALFVQAAEHCGRLNALGDIHASADYRRSLAGTMVRRSLAAAYERACGGKDAHR